MSYDLLTPLLQTTDVVSPEFVGEEVAVWPSGVLEALLELGVVRQDRSATFVTCDACTEEHAEEVVPISYPNGATRFFITCPENGRIEVPRERLLQWTVAFESLLRFLAGALEIRADPVEILPSRLWQLGRTALSGRSHTVWVARGLSWLDAQSVSQFLPTGKSAVFLLLGTLPDPALRGLLPETVVELSRVLFLSDGKLVLDRAAIEDELPQLDKTPGKKPAKKRASRAAAIDALEKTLTEHIVAARDHIFAKIARGEPPELLPRPDQKLLAAQLNLSEASVSRAFRDLRAQKLRLVWEMAGDLDQVMRFRRP